MHPKTAGRAATLFVAPLVELAEQYMCQAESLGLKARRVTAGTAIDPLCRDLRDPQTRPHVLVVTPNGMMNNGVMTILDAASPYIGTVVYDEMHLFVKLEWWASWCGAVGLRSLGL